MAKPKSGEGAPKKTGMEKRLANLAPAWKPGQSGNPAGRPKGARNKLSEDFFKALSEDFAENGVTVISTMRSESPKDYAKMIAALQSREVTGEDGESIFKGLDIVIRRQTDD